MFVQALAPRTTAELSAPIRLDLRLEGSRQSRMVARDEPEDKGVGGRRSGMRQGRAVACLRIYEIHLQGKRVSVSEAPSAHIALLDYVSALGGREGDILRLGSASLSWRGAVYTAVAAPSRPDSDVNPRGSASRTVREQRHDESGVALPAEDAGRERARQSSGVA